MSHLSAAPRVVSGLLGAPHPPFASASLPDLENRVPQPTPAVLRVTRGLCHCVTCEDGVPCRASRPTTLPSGCRSPRHPSSSPTVVRWRLSPPVPRPGTAVPLPRPELLRGPAPPATAPRRPHPPPAPGGGAPWPAVVTPRPPPPFGFALGVTRSVDLYGRVPTCVHRRRVTQSSFPAPEAPRALPIPQHPAASPRAWTASHAACSEGLLLSLSRARRRFFSRLDSAFLFTADSDSVVRANSRASSHLRPDISGTPGVWQS